MKALNIEQEKEESTATFLQRLKDTMRKYSGMDPNDTVNVPLVRIQFVTKAWPDISKQLQKLDNWTTKSIDNLLKEAQKVYIQRSAEKVKQKARMMVATVKEVVK